jgi:hypothetical protein
VFLEKSFSLRFLRRDVRVGILPLEIATTSVIPFSLPREGSLEFSYCSLPYSLVLYRYFGSFPRILFSWFQGYQYTQGSRIHQIYPEDFSPVYLCKSPPQFLDSELGRGATHRDYGTTLGTGTIEEKLLFLKRRKTSLSGAQVPERIPALLVFLRRFRFSKKPVKKQLRRILGEGIQRKDLNPPDPRSKGNQEAFRREPRDRFETPIYFYFRKGRERKRDYRYHPYWYGEGTTRNV